MTSSLANRCENTIDYRSKGYVEDAQYYARWILRMKDAAPDERRAMLRELGANVPQSIDDELSSWRVQLIEASHGNLDAATLMLMNRLLEIVAELRVQILNLSGT